MSRAPAGGRSIVYLTLFAGLVLAIWPLPDIARPFWPAWLGMIIIYWGMALPQRVSVGIAWAAGLLLDVLHGALLGEHALALTVLALLTRQWHLRLRVFPVQQQMLAVALLLVVYELILFWIRGIAGSGIPLWNALGPALTSAVAWPWLFYVLRGLRRRYQVN